MLCVSWLIEVLTFNTEVTSFHVFYWSHVDVHALCFIGYYAHKYYAYYTNTQEGL